jgi:hypothetical protein
LLRSAAAKPSAYATECDSTVGEDERSGDNLRRSTPSLNSDAARSSCCTRAARELVFAQNLDPIEFCSELTGSIVILSRIVLVTAAHRRAVSELTNSELAEGRIMNATNSTRPMVHRSVVLFRASDARLFTGVCVQLV